MNAPLLFLMLWLFVNNISHGCRICEFLLPWRTSCKMPMILRQLFTACSTNRMLQFAYFVKEILLVPVGTVFGSCNSPVVYTHGSASAHGLSCCLFPYQPTLQPKSLRHWQPCPYPLSFFRSPLLLSPLSTHKATSDMQPSSPL